MTSRQVGFSIRLTFMEQFTYLLFIKSSDERQTLAKNEANCTSKPIDDVVFSDR